MLTQIEETYIKDLKKWDLWSFVWIPVLEARSRILDDGTLYI